ncbi:hypothetical protein phytr_10330 [Candidatus Phycorickettsia trachydisci]|uniref:Uncharacterized protein n=1 Tax=Candidatus Phycorickettsia trachydisci TaxID=2115978 RepID=A0A2P1P9L1_9RICK|nr:hypothetical protein [Candidatus Phycorickettsia trachydisci]AVP87961.1 hypothetical protein phytr_10330 [Candidatus Phycorickettsia trachydisci]
MSRILLDMNYPAFQQSLFGLEKVEQRAILNTLKKISQLSWEALYIDKGIKWELITSKRTARGNNLYSFRFSKKYRGTAYRDGEYLVILNLFVDHDSAYE